MTQSPSSKRSASPYDQPPPESGAPRRNVLTAFLAGAISLVLGAVPFGAGLLVLLDPILKQKKNGSGGGEHGSDNPFLRVASLDSLPSDGTPVQVPVLNDLVDAWNRERNQPVGAVYLLREGSEVKCYNAICPHAGCFVGYSTERRVFQCPCHTSAFELSGSRILPSPSPRDLDPLEIDAEKLKAGEVWVKFVNYYPGKENREAKA